MDLRLHIAMLFLCTICLSCNRGGKSADRTVQATEKSVTIGGSLEKGAGEQVVLEEMGARELIPVDTVTCDQEGSFEISFSPDRVAFYALRLGGPGYITLLIEPGESLYLSGTYGTVFPYRVEGSEGSALLRELASEHKKALDALGEISRKNREMAGSSDYPEIKSRLDRRFDSITTAFTDYSKAFIHQHPESLSILVALYNLYGQGLPVFSPHEHMDVYQFVDSALMSNYSEFEAVRLLHAQIMEAEQQLSREKTVAAFHNGDIAPDFVSSRPDGEELALSDLRGNYVLLSFWAGWSKLSRDENATLRQAYELYGDRTFRILQVSLDNEKEVWLRAIEEDGLIWDHVSELKRWESAVADLYRLEKIPSNFLIDPAGRIIASDLFGDELLERLSIIFDS